MLTKIKYSFLKNKLKTPIYLIFFVTNKCNSACRHCFYSSELNIPARELSLPEIDSFSKELGKLVWLSYSGGEPFLREDLFDTYKIFAKNNGVDHIVIPTNGILTERIHSVVSKIAADGSFKTLTINLSLEGPKDVHDDIRGVSCYDNVLETYRALVPLKRRYRKMSLMVATILTRRNSFGIKDFHIQVKSDMPEIDYHNFEIARGTRQDERYVAPTTEQLKKIRKDLFEIWRNYDYYPGMLQSRIADKAKKLLYDRYIKIMETGRLPWPCLAGRVHAVIDYKGDLSFCELLPKIGNLKEDTFKDIWNGDVAQKLRSSIDKRACSCTHSCFHITNLLFSHRYWPKLLI